MDHRSECPISYTLDFVGDKWSLLVIRDLMFKTKISYGEFLSSSEGISTNILADRLSRLTNNGVISKTVDPDDRKRKIYALTAKGRDLGPMLVEMILWGSKHDPESPVSAKQKRELSTNRDGFLRRMHKRNS